MNDADRATPTAETLALLAAAARRLLTGAGGETAPGESPAGGMHDVLAGLVALRELRARLDSLEPGLIEAARGAGASWAQLAPVLGVASRQAAERRYLRIRQPDADGAGCTRDQRVQAERDRRAGERAIVAWARSHGADLRQLAGQVTALTDLGRDAQPSLDRLHHALGGDDAAALLPVLAETRRHLGDDHASLAERIASVTHELDRVRDATRTQRTHRRANDESPHKR